MVEFLRLQFRKQITVAFLEKDYGLFSQFKAGWNSPIWEPVDFRVEK